MSRPPNTYSKARQDPSANRQQGCLSLKDPHLLIFIQTISQTEIGTYNVLVSML